MTFRPFRVSNTMTQKVAETAGKEYGMYIKTMENRKVLVKRLERLTGTKAVYTRMPECAFVVGDFKVERYGTLVIGDDADAEVIEALLSEGMIKEYVPEPEPEPEKEPEPSKVEVSFPMEGHTARNPNPPPSPPTRSGRSGNAFRQVPTRAARFPTDTEERKKATSSILRKLPRYAGFFMRWLTARAPWSSQGN